MSTVLEHLTSKEVKEFKSAINSYLNSIGLNECFNFQFGVNYDDDNETAFTMSCEFTINKKEYLHEE